MAAVGDQQQALWPLELSINPIRVRGWFFPIDGSVYEQHRNKDMGGGASRLRGGGGGR